MQILFSDEKLFDMDGVYNVENDRVWALSRAEANKNGGVMSRRKLPEKVMVHVRKASHHWCFSRKAHWIIIDIEKKVRPMALKYGNKDFDSYWTLEQDGRRPHIHHLTCDVVPSLIEKDRWPSNSPNINP